MHTTIDYGKLEGKAKEDKAIADIVNWLGKERYEKLTAEFKKEPKQPTLDGFHLMCSIAGISGYPVTVWYRRLWPK